MTIADGMIVFKTVRTIFLRRETTVTRLSTVCIGILQATAAPPW